MIRSAKNLCSNFAAGFRFGGAERKTDSLMKNLFAKIKTACLTVVAWLNQWAKDHILHFAVADNIATVSGIILSFILGWILSPGWIAAAVVFITVAVILLKDCWIDDSADWRDILAGLIGLAWALLKLWLFWLAIVLVR